MALRTAARSLAQRLGTEARLPVAASQAVRNYAAEAAPAVAEAAGGQVTQVGPAGGHPCPGMVLAGVGVQRACGNGKG